jgi:hypothetical protein
VYINLKANANLNFNFFRDKKVQIEQEIKMKEKQLNDSKMDVSKLKADLAEVRIFITYIGGLSRK